MKIHCRKCGRCSPTPLQGSRKEQWGGRWPEQERSQALARGEGKGSPRSSCN